MMKAASLFLLEKIKSSVESKTVREYLIFILIYRNRKGNLNEK